MITDAARVIASLAALGQQFSGPTGPQADFPNGEYLAGSVTSISADGLTSFATIAGKVAVKKTALASRALVRYPHYGTIKTAYKPVGRAARTAAATSLIAWTVTVVELLELTTGFGPPDEGDEFQDSSQQFSALSGRLASAVPDDSWQGAASHAYAGKSTALATSAQWMADLDLQLATLIHDQADCVTHIRLGFGILKDLLLGAYCIELKMILSSPSGLAAAQIFARTVSSLGMLIALGMLSALSICSYENAEHADDLVPQYGLLSKAPVKRGAGVQAKVATAAGQSRASSFETVWAGMPKTSAVAPVADGASGAADQRAALSTRRDGAVRDGAAAVGQVPPGLGPGAPTVSMPTLAEVWAWSGRAAALSGHVSPHVNLVN